LAGWLIATKPSLAADFYWVGDTGTWDNNVANWSDTEGGAGGFGPPGVDDTAFLYQSGVSNIEVTHPGSGSTLAVDFLRIDATGTGEMTFSQSQGNLDARNVYVGDNGTGAYDQTDGAMTLTNILLLARFATGEGEYNFSGGTISALGEIVGFEGVGVFNQTDGVNTVTSTFRVGDQASGTGTYNLGGATSSLTSPEAFIGLSGDGTFIQTDGIFTVVDPINERGLNLGFWGGSSGTYELQAGTLVAKNEYVGIDGQGVFTQTGGLHTVGDTIAKTGDLYLSYVNSTGAATGGPDAGRSGRYDLNGGSLEVGDDTFIGLDGPGTFNQTAGTQTIGDRLVLGSRTLAATAGTPEDVLGTGVYNLSGGNVASVKGEIGEYGLGTFNQTGGTFTLDLQLQIGKETSSVGIYNLSDGNLAIGSSAIIVGSSGWGTFNQTVTTGSMTVAAFQNLGGTGTYNLQAGSLTAGVTISNNIGGNFNYSGGSLSANLITNDGSFVVKGGSSLSVDGKITNRLLGTITIDENTQATFTENVENLGTLNVTSGSTAIFAGTLSNEGSTGAGEVQALGGLQPGTSPGTMSFGGDLTMGPSTNLEIELGGTTPGAQFDRIDIVGMATLAGTLEVLLVDIGGGEFAPTAGESFEILAASGGVSGIFDSIIPPPLTGSLLFNVNYDLVNNRVLLEITTPFSADFDGDGDVDASDLAQWDGDFGLNGLSDADGDSDSDGTDFLAWQRQFTGNLTATTAVPEPAAWVLLLLAVGYYPVLQRCRVDTATAIVRWL